VDGGGDAFVDIGEGCLELLFWLCHGMMIVKSSECWTFRPRTAEFKSLRLRIIYYYGILCRIPQILERYTVSVLPFGLAY
jgi:hypothetical protein